MKSAGMPTTQRIANRENLLPGDGPVAINTSNIAAAPIQGPRATGAISPPTKAAMPKRQGNVWGIDFLRKIKKPIPTDTTYPKTIE